MKKGGRDEEEKKKKGGRDEEETMKKRGGIREVIRMKL